MVNFKHSLTFIFCLVWFPLAHGSEACWPPVVKPISTLTLPIYRPTSLVAESPSAPCPKTVESLHGKQLNRFDGALIQPKRMLFAFDGTGNDSSSLTNVWRFAQGYRNGVVHYLPGPGRAIGVNQETDSTDAALAWSAGQRVAIQWQRLLEDLSNKNNQMTSIDVVGFSRGAALARHFVNKIVKHVKNGRFWFQHPTLGKVVACVDLRFLGLFDTVAQFHLLGITDQTFDLEVPKSWRNVSHAVALHEYRWAFPLTAAVGDQVREQAFVGAHADIGGGYLTPSTSPGSTPGDLSEVALRWMVGQAHMAGVEIDDPTGALLVENLSQVPVVHTESHHFWGAMSAKDRKVGNMLQGQLAHIGRKMRENVEGLIRRPLPGATVATDVAGWVNMRPYATWLKKLAIMP